MSNQPKEFSLVDALRPTSGQQVCGMVISTFSLDLIALLALMRGLGGVEAESDSENLAGDLRAIFRLMPRVLVICQRGRVKPPSIIGRARRLALIDSVREVGFDERAASWHAKFVLTAYSGAEGPEWRLWLGSRNLSRSTDLDYGILLLATPSAHGKKAKPVPGLAAALGGLLKKYESEVARIFGAVLPAKYKNQKFLVGLGRYLDEALIWTAPRGVVVEQMASSTAGSYTRPIWQRPNTLPTWSELWAVAPFVNKGGLNSRELSSWLSAGAQKRRPHLVATRESLDVLEDVVRERFELRSAGFTPSQQAHGDFSEEEATSPEGTDDIVDDDAAGRGLHAKLLLCRRKGGPATLVFGSANLTNRALAGRNAEIVARLSMPDAAAERLVEELKGISVEYTPPKTVPDLDASDAQSSLERARAALVTELDPILDFTPPVATVVSRSPNSIAGGFKLEAKLLVRPDLSSEWKAQVGGWQFEPVDHGDFSDWIVFGLSNPSIPELRPVVWLQKARMARPEDLKELRKRRDAATSALLGLEGLCDLIAAELGGYSGGALRKKSKRQAHPGEIELPVAFRIEDLLRNRARRPEAWEPELTEKIELALEELERQAQSNERERIGAFRQIWAVFREAFVLP